MILKGNRPSHYSNIAALTKGFLDIYGPYNPLQNCNNGEVVSRSIQIDYSLSFDLKMMASDDTRIIIVVYYSGAK
jgi:hypothetical protein